MPIHPDSAQKKVSVIMPVFNGGHYISAAIESVLNQTWTNLELIVVNDGSTDDTSAIASVLAKRDPRLKLINRMNSGKPSWPKNDGLAAATGEYICFLDHDDLYEPERILRLVSGLEQHPDWMVVFHDCRFINSQGELLPTVYLNDHQFLTRAANHLTQAENDWFECDQKFFIYQSLVTGAIHTSTVMIAKHRLPEDMLYFDTQFWICDDTDLWIRLGMQGKMGFLNQTLSFYRQHETSITQNHERLLIDTALLHKHNFRRVNHLLAQDQLKQLRKKIAACLSDVAYCYFKQGRFSEARSRYYEALTWFFSPKILFSIGKTLLPMNLIKRFSHGFVG